jgi:hypothetical protein
MSVFLDIAVGMLVVFLLFSIAVTGLGEWFAQVFAQRGYFLRMGMHRLINDEAVYRRVLHHPLIGSLYRDRAAQGKPPSYVEPANFALAIAQVLLSRGDPVADRNGADAKPLSVEALRAALRSPALAGSPVTMALSPILDRAGNDLEAALKGIEAWFGSAMDRVGGWYKARTQKVLFATGFALAMICNVDAIEIYSTLNHSAALRASLGDVGQSMVESGKIGEVDISKVGERPLTDVERQSLQSSLATLRANGGQTLPIGYACLSVAFKPDSATVAQARNPLEVCGQELRAMNASRSPAAWLLKLIGWALTALAGTLGAPYWFQLLSKAINIRGTGNKPPKPQTAS